MFKISILAIVALLFPVLIFSQEKDTALPRTFLWEISGNGLSSPSYLFGTIHLICEKDIKIPASLKNKIRKAQEVFFEEKPFHANGKRENDSLLKTMFITTNTTLKKLLGRKNYKNVMEVLEVFVPIEEDQLNRMKPFYTNYFLHKYMMNCNTDSYEEAIEDEVPDSIPIHGLENSKEHRQVIDNIPLQRQAQQLLYTADSLEKTIKAYEHLMELYKNRELLKAYLTNYDENNEGHVSDRKTLLDNRNITWVPRIMAAIKTKSVFFAVGCAHLPGKNGLINLLRQEGYTISPVYY